MVTKTFVIYAVTFAAYGFIVAHFLPLWIDLLLCVVIGLGFAAMGMAIAHDSIHGAYSKNKTVNYILGYTMNMIGGNRYVWSITHNIVHHTYTNVHHVDEDLELAPFIRLSPHDKYRKIHRAQHILAFIAYGFATFFWVLFKDYKKLLQRDLGPYKNKKHPAREIVILIAFKLVYYAYTIIIPLMIFSWWQWLIGFMTIHFTAGVMLGITFQMAHTVENTEHLEEFHMGDSNKWAEYQLRTTSNFANRSKILCWYMGGLNFQVEHHLFPKICSVHYPEISKIVRDTAHEYGFPYHQHDTFGEAIASHYRFLKRLGSPDNVLPATAV